MPDEGQVPWEDGQFDEEKAKQLILNLRKEKESLQTRLKDANAKSKNAGSASADLQAENDKLKIQLQTGLNDRQVARLVGDTLEEKLEDAKAYADETGVELRSFFDTDAGEGTPGEPGSEGGENGDGGQQPEPQVGLNYRAPTQQVQQPAEEDLGKMAQEILEMR